jgi:hypothetical protein
MVFSCRARSVVHHAFPATPRREYYLFMASFDSPAVLVEDIESAQQPVQQQAASKYRPAGQDWFKCA